MEKRYKCVRRSVIRAGFEMDSDKAGTLEKGTVIEVLEERVNAEGITRVRFAGGWTSLVTGAGLVVLSQMHGVARHGKDRKRRRAGRTYASRCVRGGAAAEAKGAVDRQVGRGEEAVHG